MCCFSVDELAKVFSQCSQGTFSFASSFLIAGSLDNFSLNFAAVSSLLYYPSLQPPAESADPSPPDEQGGESMLGGVIAPVVTPERP